MVEPCACFVMATSFARGGADFMNTPRFYIRRDAFGEGIEIRFGHSELVNKALGEHRIFAAEPVAMKVWEPGTAPTQPMMYLHHSEAQDSMQSLMDQLWRLGVRPSDIGTPGHLAATTKHLEDMRALVFAGFTKLDVPKPHGC